MSSFYSTLLFLLLTLAASSFSQRLTFLRLPSSVSLSSSSSSSSSALPVDQIESLVAKLVGLPAQFSWSGLSAFSSLDRPKANLLLVVDGLKSPEALDFQPGVELSFNADASKIIDEGFRGLGQSLSSSFKASPLLLTNDAVNNDNDAANTVNGAFEQSQNAINRVAGAMKMKEVFKPRHLNISEPADVQFLAELSEISFLVDTLASVATLKPLIDDATPDAFLFRFRSLKGVMDAHGDDSLQCQEARSVLKKFIESLIDAVEAAYGGEVAVELVTLPSQTGSDAAHSRRRRALEADPDPNIAAPYAWSYAATFNMSIWTGVILVVVVYLVAYGMWNMDPGRDGYVYRMTMPKNRNS